MNTALSEKDILGSTRFLDGARGLAALYVVLHHARYLVTAGFAEGLSLVPERYSLVDLVMFYALAVFRYGHEAVIFFFVLSGFVIHLRCVRAAYRNPAEIPFNYKEYVLRRARRIYPPLLAAIVITFALDRSGMWLGSPIYFGKTGSTLINATIDPSLDFATLIGNLCLVMKCYTPVWGSNGPLWSLHYEWWFYMAYPLIIIIYRQSRWLASVLVFGATLASLIPHPAWMKLPFQVCSMISVWWLGALLAELYVRGGRRSMLIMSSASILLPVTILGLNRPLKYIFSGFPEGFDEILRVNFLGVGFCGLLAIGFAIQRFGYSLGILNRLQWLGDMSYTLYVVHFPVLTFIGGLILLKNGSPVLPYHGGWVLPSVILAMIVSYLLHFVVERPFTGHGARAVLPKLHPAENLV